MLGQYKISIYYFLKVHTIDPVEPISYYGKPINGEINIIKDIQSESEMKEKGFRSKREAEKYLEELKEDFLQWMEPIDFYLSIHQIDWPDD